MALSIGEDCVNLQINNNVIITNEKKNRRLFSRCSLTSFQQLCTGIQSGIQVSRLQL